MALFNQKVINQHLQLNEFHYCIKLYAQWVLMMSVCVDVQLGM